MLNKWKKWLVSNHCLKVCSRTLSNLGHNATQNLQKWYDAGPHILNIGSFLVSNRKGQILFSSHYITTFYVYIHSNICSLSSSFFNSDGRSASSDDFRSLLCRYLYGSRCSFVPGNAMLVLSNQYKIDPRWRDTPTDTITEIRSCDSQRFYAYFITNRMGSSMDPLSRAWHVMHLAISTRSLPTMTCLFAIYMISCIVSNAIHIIHICLPQFRICPYLSF